MNDDERRMPAEEMIGRLTPVLSPRVRVRAVTALLSGLAGAAFVATLWASEPGPLPGRTRVAFGLFIVLGLAWACYGGWLITRRAPLFARDRVIAAWLAVAASGATTALMAAVAVQRGTGLGAALAGGSGFVALALVLAVRARARHRHLLRQRDRLSRERG
ncbi:hypothetical protein [Nonomuraea lactucae]|uniref:hypothetical protein n=1 Tax=Nonomuraea lactucae TaxID=2249762 RepID=UPI001F058CA7|nr:hypothetical protein [Nonomuraea lactucae]